MRRIHLIAGIGALLVVAASAAPTPEVETRIFEGAGSVGTDSRLEVYLLEGTYHHRLSGSSTCYTAASVFPARSPNGVPLSDVLDADLSVGTRSGGSSESSPTGTVVISRAGWANLQVGTGSECTWTYSITGRFLPEGEEPVPPSERSQWWLAAAGVIAVAGLLLLVWRRRPPAPTGDDDPVRVLDGS